MISKEQLKEVLIDQYESVLAKDTGIRRDALLEISSKIKLPHIHIITGLRRCGKSVLLRQIMKEYFADSGFYYINFEDERLFNFPVTEFNLIYESLLELFGKQNTFFIDEIQNVENFEIFVRRFYDNGFKFFITGSNAALLSSEIATKLTGRHIDTYLRPFSFTEYLNFKSIRFSKNDIYKTEKKVKLKTSFTDYLIKGGMPEYLKYEDKEILNRTYNDIVLKDIVVRYKLENILQLKLLYNFLLSNYARRYSYNSLRKAVNLGSSNTVINYLHHLEQTYFIKQLSKFDYSIKKQIANEKKAYVIDNGFITCLSPMLTKDHGWLLENLVFNELTNDNDVFYYSGKNECDFVCVKNSKFNEAIQVSLNIDKNNEYREINGVTEAMQQLKINRGTILTLDTEKEIKQKGIEIKIIPVWKWILNKNNI